MGNLALPGDNDTNFKEESLFENTIAHHLGDNPLQGSAFFNIKTPLGVADQNDNSGPRFLDSGYKITIKLPSFHIKNAFSF